jgi:hypothetical protein
MRGAIPPLPQYVFMAWWLVKHRDSILISFHVHLGRTRKDPDQNYVRPTAPEFIDII